MSAAIDQYSPYAPDMSWHVRSLADGEERAVQQVFDGMSPQSRFLRFLAPVPRLLGSARRRLAAVDGHDRVALVAEVGGRPVGEARYFRDAGDRGSAEFALAVVDEYQGRGLGASLLSELIARAAEGAIDRLTFSVHPDNRRMLEMLRRRGASFALVGGVYEGQLPVVGSTKSASASSSRSRSVTSGRW
jgi:RimJ/RimL family protein N-acetyltransferase